MPQPPASSRTRTGAACLPFYTPSPEDSKDQPGTKAVPPDPTSRSFAPPPPVHPSTLYTAPMAAHATPQLLQASDVPSPSPINLSTFTGTSRPLCAINLNMSDRKS